MSIIDYNDRKFRPVENTENGEVSGETTFHYHQEGDIVWATYEGESVRFGTLVAKVQNNDRLEMRYSHINTYGELKTGECHSSPEILPDGRIRLHESWRWTSGDRSEGKSVIEEIKK